MRRTNKEEEDINNRIEASLLFRTYLMGGVLYLSKHASFWPQNVIKPDSIISVQSPFSYLQKSKEIKLKILPWDFFFWVGVFLEKQFSFSRECNPTITFRERPLFAKLCTRGLSSVFFRSNCYKYGFVTIWFATKKHSL